MFLTNTLAAASESFSVPVSGLVDRILTLEQTVTGSTTDPTLLEEFISGTPFFIDVAARHNFSAQYANGGAMSPDFEIKLSYVYIYTAVPEPRSWALAGCLGLLFFLLRRRRISR